MASATQEESIPWRGRPELALISSLVRECNGELGLPLLSRTDVEAAIANPVNERAALNETLVRLHFNLATTLTSRRMATILSTWQRSVFLCLQRIGEENDEAVDLARRLSRGGYQAWTMDDRVTALFLLASHRAEAEGPVRDRIREAALEARPTVRPQLFGTDAAGHHVLWFGDECWVYAHSGVGVDPGTAGSAGQQPPTPRGEDGQGPASSPGPFRATSSGGQKATGAGGDSSSPLLKLMRLPQTESTDHTTESTTSLAYELLVPRVGAAVARLLCTALPVDPPLPSRPWGTPIPTPGVTTEGDSASGNAEEREGGAEGPGEESGAANVNGRRAREAPPSPASGQAADASSPAMKPELGNGVPRPPAPGASDAKPDATVAAAPKTASPAQAPAPGQLPPFVAHGTVWTEDPPTARRGRLRVLCRSPEGLADLIASLHRGESGGPTDLLCYLVRLLDQEGSRALEARKRRDQAQREFEQQEASTPAPGGAPKGTNGGEAAKSRPRGEATKPAPPAKRRRATADYGAAAFVSGEGLNLSESDGSDDEDGSGEEEEGGDQTEWEGSASESSGEGGARRRTAAHPPFQLPPLDPSLSHEGVLRLLCSAVLRHLASHPDADPFLEPVAWKELGLDDYPDVVTEPMDLGTLKAAVARGTCPSWAEFQRRLNLIWNNCHRYNQPGSDVSRAATALRRTASEATRAVEASSHPMVRAVVDARGVATLPPGAAAHAPARHPAQRPSLRPPPGPGPRPQQHAMQFGGVGGGGRGLLQPRWAPAQPQQQQQHHVAQPRALPQWAYSGMMGHEAGAWAGAGFGHPSQYMPPAEAGGHGAQMGAGYPPQWAMWPPPWGAPPHAGQAFIPHAYAPPAGHDMALSQQMALRGAAPSFLFPGGPAMQFNPHRGHQ